MKKIIITAVAFLLFGVSLSITHEAAADQKSQYHLFNPTPRELMRDMSTDRPDKTESPYTVDAGHYQVEASLLEYVYDHKNAEGVDRRVDNFSVVPLNLKVGMLNNMDFQLILSPYLHERQQEAGEVSKKRGFGDIQNRLKINIWGNDGGPTALAIMPFVKFATNSDNLGNKAVEGGIILPLAVSLPGDWSMGVMTEFDFKRNDNKDYYTDYVNTITFGHQIIGKLNGYVEFFSSFNDEDNSPWVGTTNFGFTYAVSPDVQLDGGVNIGVTRSADDFNPFLGCSIRY